MQASTGLPDRIFFGLAGAWFVVLSFTGFSHSFYLRALPEPLPTHQVVHGTVFSAWVVLFFAQSLLISTGHIRWHMKLGALSVLLLILMIPVGFHVVLVKVAAGLKSVDDAGFNLTQLVLGFAFAFTGLACRRQPLVHKRMMLFATLMLTVAAADRVSLVLGYEDVRLFRKLLTVTPAIALVGFDAFFQRRTVLLSLSSLVLVWLVLWFTVSDVIFMHTAGDTIIRALTRLVVW